MKIMLVSGTHIEKKAAGVAKVAKEIYNHLTNENHDVEVLCFGKKEEKTQIENIRTRTFKTKFNISISFLRFIITQKFDFCILIGNDSISITVASVLLSLKRIKFFIIPAWHQDFKFTRSYGKILFHIKRKIIVKIPYFLLKPRIVCFTKYEREEISNFVPSDKVKVVNFGVRDINKFKINQNVSINYSNDESNLFTILIVGGVYQNKIPLYFLDTLALFQRRGFNFKVIVNGRIIDENYYRIFVKRGEILNVIHRIHFTGATSRKELLRHYEECSMFLSLSFSESFGIAIVEAIGHGIPTISVSTGIVVDLKKYNCVEIIEYGDYFSQEKALEKMYNDTNMKKRLSDNCVKLRKKFDIKNYFKGISNLIEEQ